MSWIEEIKSGLTITTGDGEKYTPKWLNASHKLDFQIAEFTFPGVDGALVERRRPKGRKYTLEIYFEGEDHLTEAAAFEVSTLDPAAWTIEHPFYGKILCQPNGLTFDQNNLNATKITGSLLETIETEGVKEDVNAVDSIEETADATNAASADQLELEGFAPGDIADTKSGLQKGFDRYKKTVTTNSQINDLTNAYNEAQTALNGLIIAPVLAMRKVHKVLTLPYTWENKIEDRIGALSREFNSLITTASSYTTSGQKKYVEGQTTALITAVCNSAAQPIPGDYNTRTDVENVIGQIVVLQNDLITFFDSLASDDYTPSQAVFSGIDEIVNFTISELFNIALSAKQERIYVLNKDSDVISLTHKLIGLDATDENIDMFIGLNNIGLDTILTIKKGTKVLYLV